MSGAAINGAARMASPAAGLCMSGTPFLLKGRVARVEERYASLAGLQLDVLQIRFAGLRAPDEIGVLGTTVRLLEQHIKAGQVEFLHDPTEFSASLGRRLDGGDVMPNFRSRYTTASNTTRRARPLVGSTSAIADDHGSGGATRYAHLSSVRTSFTRPVRRDRQPPVTPGRAAFLAIFTCKPSRSIRKAHADLCIGWQPEWGRRPSYSTVRRWVRESCVFKFDSSKIVRLGSSQVHK